MTPQVNYPASSPPFPPTKRRKVKVEEVPSSPPVCWRLFEATPLAPLMAAATPFGEEDPFCRERSSCHLEFQLSREQVLVNLP